MPPTARRPLAPLAFATLFAALTALAGCGASAGSPDVPTVAPDGDLPDESPPDVDATAPPVDATAPADAPATPDVTRPAFPVSHAVRVIVEPSDRGAAVLSAIAGARTSVHMTMYLLSSRDVIDALIAAHARGVDVRVLLNRTFPNGAGSNTAPYNQLMNAGVMVRWAPSSFTFTHEKAMVIDGREAWIMTMNATGSSSTANREYLVVDTEADDVRDVEEIFAGDFVGAPLTSYAGHLVLSPLNAQGLLVQLVNSATRTLDIESEEFEDRTVSAAIAARARAGVTVRMVLTDQTPSSSSMRAITTALAAGVHIVTVHTPYMHAKTVVADGAVAYVGSENLSFTSLTANRELGVLFDTPAQVSTVLRTIAADFAMGTAM